MPLDPLQFAYRTKSCGDDAKLFIVHTLNKHVPVQDCF